MKLKASTGCIILIILQLIHIFTASDDLNGALQATFARVTTIDLFLGKVQRQMML